MNLDARMHVDLSPLEIRILTQSLQNCLATCRTHAKEPDAPCEDCDAARALLKKLQSTSAPEER